MTDFTGTTGNDSQTGTSGDDNFFYDQGGRDTLLGKGGNDAFKMGTSLRANDRLDGGAGTFDVVQLFGAVTPYSVVFDNNTIVNCEALQMSPGGVYSVTMADGNIAAGRISACWPPLRRRCSSTVRPSSTASSPWTPARATTR